MSSAIEVLKKDLKSYEYLKANNKIIKTLNNEEVCMIHYPEIKEAIVALEQKENDRKQGALEELYALSYYCGKAQVGEETIKRKISKRIKELEGVEQK